MYARVKNSNFFNFLKEMHKLVKPEVSKFQSVLGGSSQLVNG